MRRAKKGKNIFITVSLICVISAGVFSYVKMKDLKVDTQVSIEEPTYSADSIPEKQNFPQNRGVEIVSVDEDAILDQKKNSNINASKQSSLEKAIDNLMNQTETE